MFSTIVLFNYKEQLGEKEVPTPSLMLRMGVRTEPRAAAFKDYVMDRMSCITGQKYYLMDDSLFQMRIHENNITLLVLTDVGYVEMVDKRMLFSCSQY